MWMEGAVVLKQLYPDVYLTFNMIKYYFSV